MLFHCLAILGMKNEKLRIKNWGSFVPNTPTGVAFRFGGNVSVLQRLLGEFFIKKIFQKTFSKALFCNIYIAKETNFNINEGIGKQSFLNFSFLILILRSSRF